MDPSGAAPPAAVKLASSGRAEGFVDGATRRQHTFLVGPPLASLVSSASPQNAEGKEVVVVPVEDEVMVNVMVTVMVYVTSTEEVGPSATSLGLVFVIACFATASPLQVAVGPVA